MKFTSLKHLSILLILTYLIACEERESEIDKFKLAEFYYESGNYAQSLDFLREEIESNSIGWQAHMLSAKIFNDVEYFADGIYHLRQAISLGCQDLCEEQLVEMYLKNKNFDLAEKAFMNLRQNDSVKSRFSRILLDYNKHGDSNLAIQQLEEISEEYPAVRENILEILFDQRRYPEVIRKYNDSADYTMGELLIFSKVYYLQEQYDEADKVLLDMQLKDSGQLLTGKKIEAMELLVRVKVAKGQFESAEKIYQVFLKNYENTSYVSYRRGIDHLMKSEFDAASKELDPLVNTDSDNIGAAQLEALLEFGKGNYQNVITTLEPYKSELDGKSLVILSSSYNKLGRMQDTINLLSADKLTSRQSAILARAYYLKNDRNRALNILDKTLEDKADPGSASYIALVMFEMGLHEKIVSRFSKNRNYPPSLKYLVVKSYLELNQEEDARQYIKNESNREVNLGLTAYLESKSGKVKDMIASYRQLVNIKPSKKYYVLLAKSYIDDKDYSGALSTIQSAISITGDNTGIFNIAKRLLRSSSSKETVSWLETFKSGDDFIQAQKVLANFEIYNGNVDDAWNRLKKIENAADHFVYFLMAKSREQVNRQESVDYLEKSLDSRYSHRIASLLHRHYLRNNNLENLNRINELIKQYSGANIVTAFELSAAYLKLGKLEEISQLAATLIQQGQQVAGIELEGDLLYYEKDFSGAAEKFLQAAQTDPTGRLLVKHYKSKLKVPENNSQSIFKDIEKRLDQSPDLSRLRYFLAEQLIGLDQKRAKSHFEWILRKTPKSVVVLNNLAWISLELDPSAALKYAEAAFQLDSNNSSILDTYVRALKINNQQKKAEVLIKQKLAEDPENEAYSELMKEISKQ